MVANYGCSPWGRTSYRENHAATEACTTGGAPRLRMKDGKPLITDNGCLIIDVVGMKIANPIELEAQINNIVDVVTVGLFARQGASVCLLGTAEGVKTLKF